MQGLELDFPLPGPAPLSLSALALSLAIGAVLAVVLRWHFERFGSTLSNRSEFAQVFPLIVLTTVLIISVVKSSLALSLGLVGARSIVRFRTPIKEPEELAYLFLAIAIGLGLGANQIAATLLSSSLILVVVGALRWARSGRERSNLYLSLEWAGHEPAGEVAEGEHSIDAMHAIIGRHASTADLRRVSQQGDGVDATFFVEVAGPERIAPLVAELQARFPEIDVTFVDQNLMPSV